VDWQLISNIESCFATEIIKLCSKDKTYMVFLSLPSRMFMRFFVFIILVVFLVFVFQVLGIEPMASGLSRVSSLPLDPCILSFCFYFVFDIGFTDHLVVDLKILIFLAALPE
jgi:hypothetical protein